MYYNINRDHLHKHKQTETFHNGSLQERQWFVTLQHRVTWQALGWSLGT